MSVETPKLVVTGPFGAGKTTLVRAVSDTAVIQTERAVSDETAAIKPGTTVAMDFGSIAIAPDLTLLLYGTPGQRRFEFMWEILATGMLGYVLLVDVTAPETFDDAAAILRSFRDLSDTPYVIAANRADGLDDTAIARLRHSLAADPTAPVLACQADDRESAKAVLLALLAAALDRVDVSVTRDRVRAPGSSGALAALRGPAVSAAPTAAAG